MTFVLKSWALKFREILRNPVYIKDRKIDRYIVYWPVRKIRSSCYPIIKYKLIMNIIS